MKEKDLKEKDLKEKDYNREGFLDALKKNIEKREDKNTVRIFFRNIYND